MLRYYCIYDNSLKLANIPFVARDDIEARSIVRNLLLTASDSILQRIIGVCDLRFCGDFNQEDFCFCTDSVPYVVCALSDIPLPEFNEVGGE